MSKLPQGSQALNDQRLPSDAEIPVPQDIIDIAQNYDQLKAGNDKSNAEGYRELAKRSSFIITFNPNLGKRINRNVEQVKCEYRKLYRINLLLEEQFRQGNFFKPLPARNEAEVIRNQGFQAPNVLNYTAEIETGTQKGLLHIQGLLELEGQCHIDCRAIEQWSKDNFYTTKPYVKAVFTQTNTREALLRYIHKGSALPGSNISRQPQGDAALLDETLPRRRGRPRVQRQQYHDVTRPSIIVLF